jgi:hypothetical protein
MTITHSKPDSLYIEMGLRSGYVTLLNWLTGDKGHTILVIGIDGNQFLYHDPGSPSGPARMDKTAVAYQCVEAWIVYHAPATTPSYKILLGSPENLANEYYADGAITISRELLFPLGTSHTISAPNPLFSNGGSTKHICLNSKVTVKSWTCETLNITFLYTTYHLVKARQGNQTTEEWIMEGERFNVSVKEIVLPMSGPWRQLGSVRRFVGWYSERGLLTGNITLQLEVQDPLTVEARYVEDYTSAQGALLVVAAIGIALTTLVLFARKRQTHSH